MCFLLFFFLTSAHVCSSHDKLKPYRSQFPSPALLLTHAFVCAIFFFCSHPLKPFSKIRFKWEAFPVPAKRTFWCHAYALKDPCLPLLLLSKHCLGIYLSHRFERYPPPAVVRLSCLSQSTQIKALSDGQAVW